MAATWSRILLAPIIVALTLLQPPYWQICSTLLFILAAITDWLDGYLARKLNAVSDWGKFLDPVADKVLISSVLLVLIPLKQIDPVSVMILINRDILIGGLRSYAASKGVIIAADQLGKLKTALQMVAIPTLLLGPSCVIDLSEIGFWAIWLSVVLSVVSGIQYFYNYSKVAH